MSGVALVADCGKRVGSGHVVETLNLAARLAVPWRAYLPAATPVELSRRFGRRGQRIVDLSPKSLRGVAEDARDRGFSAIALNVLRASRPGIRALRSTGLRVAALTVVGGRAGADAGMRLGGHNMIFAASFSRLAARPRAHRGGLETLLVVMGGTDASGCTAHLASILRSWRPKVRKILVMGPNFARPAELRRRLGKIGSKSFIVRRNPRDLPLLMRRADAAITLGSDTSLELACVGTPTLLLEEAPHERRQASLLAKNGCGFFIGSKAEATSEKVIAALERLDDPAVRRKMGRAAIAFVRADGAARAARLLEAMG